MATAAASVVLGQPTHDNACSTTAFLLIACGAVGIGGWPYLSHPPSCFPVLRKAPGTMQACVVAYARGVAGGDAETVEEGYAVESGSRAWSCGRPGTADSSAEVR
jgi:hypothetical protein